MNRVVIVPFVIASSYCSMGMSGCSVAIFPSLLYHIIRWRTVLLLFHFFCSYSSNDIRRLVDFVIPNCLVGLVSHRTA